MLAPFANPYALFKPHALSCLVLDAVLATLPNAIRGMLPASAPTAFSSLGAAITQSGAANYALGAPGVPPLSFKSPANLAKTVAVSLGVLSLWALYEGWIWKKHQPGRECGDGRGTVFSWCGSL